MEISAGSAKVTVKRGGPITLEVPLGPNKTARCAISLLSSSLNPAPIDSCQVNKRSERAVTCQLRARSRLGEVRGQLTVDGRGELTLLPGDGNRGARISAQYDYCVLPSRHVDDCVFAASAYPDRSHLYLPSECLLMGLMAGGDALLCVGWPPAGQLPMLLLSGKGKNRHIEAIELQAQDQPIYIGLMTAPGIWHSVKLEQSFEDQDIQLKWKPPFKAKWKVQLKELGVPTTFYLVEGKQRRWRPTVSWFIRPLYTKGGKYFLHPSKRMECTGRAFIYALDGNERTPYAFLARHLPREIGRKLIEMGPTYYVLALDPTDVPPRVMDTHCFGRDVLRYTTLAVGNVEREKEFLRTHIYDRRYEALGLTNYSFQRSVDWLNRNIAQLEAWAAREKKKRAVVEYLGGLRKLLATLRKDYFARLGGKSTGHIIRFIEQNTRAFIQTLDEDGGIELCPELLHYIRELNSINSMNEDLSRLFGTETRRVFQQAAYRGVVSPVTARYAEAIRDSIRRQLRYRSWESAVRPDYGLY